MSDERVTDIATRLGDPHVVGIHRDDVHYLLDRLRSAEHERDWWKSGMDRHGPCTCDTNPSTTSGPEEDCPHHGRNYGEWIERGDLLQERLDRVEALCDKWRDELPAAEANLYLRAGGDLSDAPELIIWIEARRRDEAALRTALEGDDA